MGRRLVILGGSSPKTPAFFAALDRCRAAGVPFDEVWLVGRSAEKVEAVGRFSRALAEELDLPVAVAWETDLGRAVRGATCVLNVLRAGGPDGEVEDRHNLALSGVVGHASSYAEVLRNLPATLSAARTVEALAPDALFINFTNPVSVLCEAVACASSLTCFGVCHHAFSMRPDFASLLGVPAERVRVEYLGLNHVGWVTDVQVDGISCMSTLVERLIQGRVKRYNYDLIRAFDVIPVQHAYSLYHKGETFYVRQKGIRGSASDVLLRPRLVARLARWRAQREGLGEVVRTRRRGALGLLAEQAPWYAACIVPFLQDVAAARPAEHIVTWQHAGQMPGMPFATAETTAVIEGRRARPAALVGRLPAVAQVWLRQVRDSERLFIQAVREGSFALAVEALAVHPNVASVRHAARFLRPYFQSTLERV